MMKKNTQEILIDTKKPAILSVGNILLSLNREIFFWFFLIIASLILSVLIVWQTFYLILFLLAAIILILFFWKTEESLIMLVIYLPFQIALNISSTIDLASGRLIIVILFMVWLLKSLTKKMVVIPYRLTTWLIIIFLGLAVVSAYFSIDREKSAVRLLFFFSIFPLYFVMAGYFNSMAKIMRVVYALLFSATLAAVAGIVQFLSQFIFGIDAIMNFWSGNIAYLFYGQSFGKLVVANPSWLVNVGGETLFRAISFFPDPHMFSFYLGLVAPIALCLALFSNIFNFSLLQKYLLYVSNVIIFLALGLTFSRAGYMGAFIGIATVVFFGWMYFRGRTKFIIAFVVLIGCITIFVSSNAIISRFFSSFNLAEGSNSERLLNWRQSFKIIEDHPVVGTGVGAYAEALSARASDRSSVTAHNTYLDIASEMGIIALLVWLIILIATVKNLILIIRSKEQDLSKEKVISLGFAGAFVWFSVQMVFDTAIYSPTLLAILMIYLAISVNLGKRIFMINR